MALLAIMLCVNLTACSDDDDDSPSTGLAGTTWKITSCDDKELAIQGEYGEIIGGTVSFTKDGKVVLNPCDMERKGQLTYSLDGTILKIIIANDDYLKGQIMIDGKKAVYSYRWYDCGGEWEGEEQFSMTLEKQ